MVPEEVRAACGRQVISHRGEDFDRLQEDVLGRLRRLFRTAGRVVVLPSSGTGALEAALVNTLSPGDPVLACVMGAFGQRFADAAAAMGLEVDRLEVPYGAVPEAEAIVQRLRGRPGGYRAVLLTHCETSAGTLLPLERVVPAIRAAAPDTLVLVDMVSSLGAVPVDVDGWGVDVAVAASQKALMTPPGLGIVALGPRALAALEEARLPRFTWDFRPYLREGVPYTPAVSLWFGLQAALARIEREGEEQVYRRHRLLAQMVRAGVRALGLEPLAPDPVASPSVTAVLLPDGIAPERLIARLRAEHGVVVVGAMGPYRQRGFRIGHMGAVQPEHVLVALDALEATLTAMGHAPAGAARDAAEALLAAAGGRG